MNWKRSGAQELGHPLLAGFIFNQLKMLILFTAFFTGLIAFVFPEEIVTVSAAGNVGILTSPTSKLDVNGDASANSLDLTGKLTATSLTVLEPTTNQPVLVVTPEQRVGIGTDKPQKTLDVSGTVKANQLETKGIVAANVFINTSFNILPAGIVMLWAGAVSDIPLGWHLCDGQSGTPDLRNRFVLGLAIDAPGEAAGPVYLKTDNHPPALAYPMGQITNTRTVVFRWVGCSLAVGYVINVATSSDFAATPPFVNQFLPIPDKGCTPLVAGFEVQSGNLCTFTITNGNFAGGQTYYWRVKCQHACTETTPPGGLFSSTGSFWLVTVQTSDIGVYKLAYIMKIQ